MNHAHPVPNALPASFSWLSVVAGASLPESSLDHADTAWAAAAEVLGVNSTELVARVAAAFHLDVADITKREMEAAAVLDLTLARRFNAVPLRATHGRVILGTSNPGDPDLVQHLRFLLRRDVEIEVLPPDLLANVLLDYDQGRIEEPGEWGVVVEVVEEGEPATQLTRDLTTLSGDDRAGRTLDSIVTRGVRLGASDVHVMAVGTAGLVRYRVDGVLQIGAQLGIPELEALLGRAKAVGGMDPSVRLRAQDGRARITLGDASYDLRFSTLPSNKWESLVVRILSEEGAPALADSGLDADSIERLHSGLLEQTAGVFIVTGPTGSGKTTLLASLMDELNTPERDIHTVEDPIEYVVPGLVQVQVNPKAGLSFPDALRSILRQDPEVILVGETRDHETAEVVAQAAITGHLVATTLHTVDAAAALLRLADMGIDVEIVGQVLLGVSGQRLLRRLCLDCREAVSGDLTADEEWYAQLAGNRPAFRAVGCDRCRHTGYAGRFPVVEVLLVDAPIRQALLEGKGIVALRELAKAGGMRSMGDLALARVAVGDTDVREVRRVMGSDLIAAPTGGGQETAAPAGALRPEPGETPAEGPLALLVSADETRVDAVRMGLAAKGLTVHVEEDIPAAFVWAEIHRPELVVLDAAADPEETLIRLSEVYDQIFAATIPTMVLAPADDLAVERVLMEHGLSDYLRDPISADRVEFLADQILRRVQVLAMAHGA